MIDVFIFKCNRKVRFSFSSSRGKLMLVSFEWVKQRLVVIPQEAFLMKLLQGKKWKRLREILCYCDVKMLMLHHNVWRLFSNKVHSRLWVWRSFFPQPQRDFFPLYIEKLLVRPDATSANILMYWNSPKIQHISPTNSHTPYCADVAQEPSWLVPFAHLASLSVGFWPTNIRQL